MICIMRGAAIMSFYWSLALVQADMACREGEWMPRTSVLTASLPCMPCPVGMKCTLGNAVQCPDDAVSMDKGAAQCCHRNITCPHGNAVSQSGCRCVPITCPHKTMVFRREMQCVNTCDSQCKVVDKDCRCSSVPACDGGTWWQTGGRYACLWLKKPT
jgi:hypothetical protein